MEAPSHPVVLVIFLLMITAACSVGTLVLMLAIAGTG